MPLLSVRKAGIFVFYALLSGLELCLVRRNVDKVCCRGGWMRASRCSLIQSPVQESVTLSAELAMTCRVLGKSLGLPLSCRD